MSSIGKNPGNVPIDPRKAAEKAQESSKVTTNSPKGKAKVGSASLGLFSKGTESEKEAKSLEGRATSGAIENEFGSLRPVNKDEAAAEAFGPETPEDVKESKRSETPPPARGESKESESLDDMAEKIIAKAFATVKNRGKGTRGGGAAEKAKYTSPYQDHDDWIDVLEKKDVRNIMTSLDNRFNVDHTKIRRLFNQARDNPKKDTLKTFISLLKGLFKSELKRDIIGMHDYSISDFKSNIERLSNKKENGQLSENNFKVEIKALISGMGRQLRDRRAFNGRFNRFSIPIMDTIRESRLEQLREKAEELLSPKNLPHI